MDKIIEVVEVDEKVGYLYVDGLTFTKGRHELWNYEKIKDGPEFQRYVASGKIVVHPEP